MPIHYPLWLEIVATRWLRHSTDLGLSFDSSLSCKLQLTDLITLSAACLASRKTILVCFFPPVKWVRRKRKETNGWKIKKPNLEPRMLEMAFQSFHISKFSGGACPRPPRLRGLTTPCSYSRVFFPNQLPTSNFIESPA